MDIPADELTVDNSWDNAGWGVQPADGSVDSQGNLLPRGYATTSWRQWASMEMAAAALSGGQTEAIVIEGLTLGDEPKPPAPPRRPEAGPAPPAPEADARSQARPPTHSRPRQHPRDAHALRRASVPGDGHGDLNTCVHSHPRLPPSPAWGGHEFQA